MFYGLNRLVKNLLPKRLFYRALLIVAIPVILIQLIITIVFFDSIWIKANKGMTKSLVSEVKTLLDAYKSEETKDVQFLTGLYKKNFDFVININKGEKIMSYIDLDSVGSTVTDEGLVFPQDISEAPETASEAEEMMGVHIYDLDNEWFCNLSSDDLLAFFDFIEETQDLTTIVYNEWKTSIWGMWEEHNNCFLNLEAK